MNLPISIGFINKNIHEKKPKSVRAFMNRNKSLTLCLYRRLMTGFGCRHAGVNDRAEEEAFNARDEAQNRSLSRGKDRATKMHFLIIKQPVAHCLCCSQGNHTTPCYLGQRALVVYYFQSLSSSKTIKIPIPCPVCSDLTIPFNAPFNIMTKSFGKD